MCGRNVRTGHDDAFRLGSDVGRFLGKDKLLTICLIDGQLAEDTVLRKHSPNGIEHPRDDREAETELDGPAHCTRWKNHNRGFPQAIFNGTVVVLASFVSDQRT